MTNKLSPRYAKSVIRYFSPISVMTIAVINPIVENILACDFATEQFIWFNEAQFAI